jgi:hypothetical protein
MSAAADTTTTIIMQMKYLQAGAKKQSANIQKKSLPIFWRSFPVLRSMA